MLPRDTCGSFLSLHTCRSVPRGSSCVSNNNTNINNNINSNINNNHALHTNNSVTAELLHAFSHAEERVMAAWTRVGLAAVDRNNKWTGFVEGRLWPFLLDYVRLQEAEEMSIAAENDRLFREMFFTALRLKEAPQAKALAQLVEAIVEQSTENTHGSSSTNITNTTTTTRTTGVSGNTNMNMNTTGHNTQDQQQQGQRDWVDHVPIHSEFPVMAQTEQTSIETDAYSSEYTGSMVLPSFVTVTTALAGKRDEAVWMHSNSHASHIREECESQQQQQESQQQQQQSEGPQEASSRSPSLSVVQDVITPHDRAWAAMWQLVRNMTHQEVRRNLESELERMNALADARLEQLSLLYKQRALLQLPPEQQTKLRSRYAEKLLSGEFHKPQHHDNNNNINNTNNEQKQVFQVPHISSCASASCSSTYNYNYNGTCTTPGPSSGRTTATCHTCISNAKDDLDLLSDSIPEQLRLVSEVPLGSNHSHLGDLSLLLHQEEEEEQKEEKQKEEKEKEVGRGTIFEVDLGDVTRFGRRQDLSLARIDTETQNIYADIIAQNTRMETQADAELLSMEELWTLFEQSRKEKVSEEEEKEYKENMNDNNNSHNEEILSRHNFMRHLTLLRQEYELSVDNGMEGSINGADVFSQSGGGSNSNVNSRRATCSSRSHRSTYSHVSTMEGRANTGYSCGSNNNNNNNINNSNTSNSMPTPLPAPLVRLFTVRSYAPILAYIISIRERLQRVLLQRHVEIAQDITQELTEMYRCYYEKTRDAAYYVAPDYSRWLQENTYPTLSHKTSSALSKRTTEGTNEEEEEEKEAAGTWQQFLNGFTPRTDNDVLRERIAEVQSVVNRAKGELEILRHRMRILSEVEPLLRRRSEIFEQQRAIQEGSRERLLSKKINMAKQLLFEENARRQFSRELPKIHEQMEELLRQWNETVMIENSDTYDCNNNNNNNHNNNSRRLVVYGIDIADLVRQFHDEKTRTAAPDARTPHPHGGSSRSRSPPPTAILSTSTTTTTTTTASQYNIGFTTPQRTPMPAPTHSQHRPPTTSISPRPRSLTSGTPVRSKTQSAKKSVSPTAVKRTPTRVGQQRVVSPTPAGNDFIRRKPQAVPLRHGLPPTGKSPITSASLNTTSTLEKEKK